MVAIVYTSLVALMQEDMKKLIAYSSVAHMGFVTMGIFALTTQGVAGGIFQMISHGIVSGALFLCVGVVYDRMHTREIAAYGGLVNRMPLYAAGVHGVHAGQCRPAGHLGLRRRVPDADRHLPGQHLGGDAAPRSASSCRPAYALWLYRKVIFGKLEKPAWSASATSAGARSVILAPLVVLTILFGVYPKPVLDMSAASVTQLIDNYQPRGRARRRPPPCWREVER